MSDASRCPACGAEVESGEAFCESCGAALGGAATEVPSPSLTAVEQDAPIELTTPTAPAGGQPVDPADPATTASPRCLSCGGEVGEDGYCTVCGTKAPLPRDHYVEQPAAWVASVCDRGVKHHRNEDATAIAAEPEPGSRAVLVVCDGVSTAPDSDVAALAAARRARDVLVALQPEGLPNPASRSGAVEDAIGRAVAQANEAVLGATPDEGPNAAACTFACAVVEGDEVVFGNVGDSRVYWLPDPGGEGFGGGLGADPEELSIDDSVAQARIAMGVDRETAENGPQAHAITKWLGRDSPDTTPRTGSVILAHPGWVLVCSDGLWNYCSEAAALGELVTSLSTQTTSPLDLAEALVRWANEQGGRDNVSVALARH